jgi:hypothetical protein
MIKQIILNAVITFSIAFIVTAIVTLLWNLIVDNNGAVVDWRTAFQFAIVMGIVLPIVRLKTG